MWHSLNYLDIIKKCTFPLPPNRAYYHIALGMLFWSQLDNWKVSLSIFTYTRIHFYFSVADNADIFF